MRTKQKAFLVGKAASLATLPAVGSSIWSQKIRRLAIAIYLALGSAAAVAGTWDETTNGGGDAHNLIPTAQVITGSGPLTRITGRLQGYAVEDPSYPNYDFVDLYQIQITDAANFSATTVDPGGSGVLGDTALWLFDASGLGVTYNNNSPLGGTALSRLTSTYVPSNGEYFLGVSHGGMYLNPMNGAFQNIWINDQNIPGGEWAPNGPGAPGPLAAWAGLDGGQTGRYRIDLTGVTMPEPTSLALLGIGGLIIGWRRR